MTLLYCPEQVPMGACSSSTKNWGWVVYTEKVLEWFNYPRARAHPGCELICQGVPNCHFMLRRGQPNSGESCIVLQSWPTRSLVAKFPHHSVIACSTQISCCRERTLQTRPRTGVCEPLKPDVVASKVQCSYVSSADLPTNSIRKNLAWWAVTQRTSKTTKLSKLGGGRLLRHGHLLGTIWYEVNI